MADPRPSEGPPAHDAGDGRRSPLHALHAAAGAQFTEFAGWTMPLRFASELTEHHAVRTAAGLFDLSHMAEIVVIGPDAGAVLDVALVSEFSALAEGRAKYSLLVDEHGGIIDDVVGYRTGPDRFLIVANAGNRQAVVEALSARAVGFDCEVFDESDDIALLALQGPASRTVLERLTPRIDGAEPGSLGRYRAAAGRWVDHELLVARTGYTGEDGFELFAAPEACRALWTALLEAGADVGLVPAGLAARDTLRLEAGMPLYGHELELGILPAQAGLGRVVDLDRDARFTGREALEAALAPDAPVLVGLTAEGRRAGRAGYPVLDGDLVVGRITSGALSPTLGHPIAMAYVRPTVAAPGTRLTIDVRGTPVAAVVTPLPFLQRKALA